MEVLANRVWKWIAVLAVLALLGHIYVWPVLTAGSNAVGYINLCIQAKVCPSPDDLNGMIAKQAAAAKPVVPAAVPTPTPPPIPEKK